MNTLKFILITSFLAVLSACGDDNNKSTASAESTMSTTESSVSTMDAEAQAKAEEAREAAKKMVEERDSLENE